MVRTSLIARDMPRRRRRQGGGALPTSTTITAEFTPARYRTFAVTATIVCVPLGGMLAGLFAGQVLPSYGWRGLFFAGGALPLVLGVVLLAALPESPGLLWSDCL